MIDKAILRIEEIKNKGLKVGMDDIHDLIGVVDLLQDKATELKSEYEELKLDTDNKIKIFFLNAKQDKLTDKVADTKSKIAYEEEQKTLIVLKAKYTLMLNKAKTADSYITLLKKLFN